MRRTCPAVLFRLRPMSRVAIVAVLAAAGLALLVVAGCSEGDVSATPETVEGTLPTETTATCPADVPACDLTGDAAAGEAIFTSAGCVSCHTLSAAGSTGTIGPNLDEAKPSYDLAVTRVTKGQGGMPSFAGQLDDQQIADVAQYVVESTSG
jgi:mono/diheme cytochrome c family protein